MPDHDRCLLAHAKRDSEGNWHQHLVSDHLSATADLASEFASAFGCSDWGRLAGLWHDLGKSRPAFQRYIRRETGFDLENAQGPAGEDTQHSIVGAIHAVEGFGLLGRILAYPIAGHHGRLPDWLNPEFPGSSLSTRLKQKNLYSEAALAELPAELVASTAPTTKPEGDPAFWIRMLFSCLVDADFLDTERFMNPDRHASRPDYGSLAQLKSVFDSHMTRMTAEAEPSEVNRLRGDILAQCRAKAGAEPGVFSLTVPTGGGKTLSSMAFALDHAVGHGLERIIYVIPYTSIIEQTADTFRGIFGRAVVEHHSALDPNDEHPANRLASENWDAPIIITTSVQFFESLHAARPGRCRKLHNIANSVVILDEAQLLPPDFLQPVIHALNELVAHYNTSICLCTATQPALDPWREGDYTFKGLPGRREIIDSPLELHRRLKRIEPSVPSDINAPEGWSSIAERLKAEPTVLGVVNTRRHARELAELMPEDTLHLSAAMCGQHRSQLIQQIKKRLEANEATRVISTQLIEAGVDLDFPVVYRALAGLDSMYQAAGRCNREGKLDMGKFVIFVPPKSSPPGQLRQAEECARQIMGRRADLFADLGQFNEFFKQLYWTRSNLDRHNILGHLRAGPGLAISFATAAKKFRFIDGAGQVPVIVAWSMGQDLIDELRADGPSRNLFRRLQRYTVTVPEYQLRQLLAVGYVEELPAGQFVQISPHAYTDRFGLTVTDDPAKDFLSF